MRVQSIHEAAYLFDGGSIYFEVRDSAGEQHKILLVQHRLTSNTKQDRLPGRIYLDDELVPTRSDTEAEILTSIESAEVVDASEEAPSDDGLSRERLVLGSDIQAFLDAREEGPLAAISHLVQEFVRYVRSEEYLRRARESAA